MDEYITTTYGDHLAEVYDQWYGAYEDAAIETLATLARGGRALELGIGTGRIAVPLAARGIEVHGIDASSAMVAKLLARPGGDSIGITMGDYADVDVEGQFSLIFVVFNTFFALLTQEEQVKCFRNVVDHLTPGGTFAIEAFVPDVTRFSGGQNVRVHTITNERVDLQVAQHDPLRQHIKSQHIIFINNEARLYPVEVRYAWPSELDLMAQLAGLELRQRWGNWDQQEFNKNSEKHISVYERVK
ncbi:MAG TPA: class I SAM-dependent methyltransferase [Blastocatellia bacterium]|nr:class I SAM-dependent methyltransferase [Blastocatellia bacterium]